MSADIRASGPAALVVLSLFFAAPVRAESTPSERAAEILRSTGIEGGFIVHLGCGDGQLTAALKASERYQVHGLDRSPRNVDAARERIHAAGLYGEVSVDRLRSNHLPYIDNLVNLLVAEDLGEVEMAEVLRVLVPNGVAYVKRGDDWEKTVKPRPSNIDDWTHFLHDASGNAVAQDDVVGPPRRLQWLGSPRWSRHHDRMASLSALVSANGRIFAIMDEGSRVSIQLPPKWKLIARDAFNGTILWKRDIPKWHSHLWPLKSGPTQLARRLVATDDVVYVTLGLEAPLVALDAATGATLRAYGDSRTTEEVIAAGDTLFLLVNKGHPETSDYSPQFNVGDQRRVANEFLWNEKKRQIMAYEAASGRLKWKRETRVSPLTLTADRKHMYFHDGSKVVCLEREGGGEVWTSEPAKTRPTFTMNFGPRLVVYRNVILFAGGDRAMTGLAADTGKVIWTAPHARSAYQSPEDLLVAGGLVWSAPTTQTRDSGVFTGRDPFTGEVKSEFAPNVDTYWFHHRCYMAKATERFLLPSRTGIEFVDHEKKDWNINHWVRGGCLYGIMPCNGLVYAPPHDCACYPEAKLFGMNALSPASTTDSAKAVVPRDEDRLEPGPAWGQSMSSALTAGDWPTFRHDATRSGHTRTEVPATFGPTWKTELGGRLSAVVVGEGKVFVAAIDAHTIHALDARTGEPVWHYTTGGRVDSPPTLWEGRVLFGSADGFVYSLRADNGKLIWRYLAAPGDRRLMAFEQLESVWPVHGNVLIEGGVAYVVAGRSNFLDGGLRLYRLDARTGRKLSERIINERDPETGENVQTRLQVLNMTAGLPDVLSSDGRWIYMRSQRFNLEGIRQELGPHSGTPAEQGAAQHGEGTHLFAPMGFLDDTWFHRAYWVYGRSFAGGHAGYYQAGKYAPSGRILVFDEENVYGFGRKPQYYRWTTTLEHQLFAASKTPPPAPDPRLVRRGAQRSSGSMIRFDKTPSIDPTGKPVTVEAWARAERPNGVVVARGGPSQGYALFVQAGRPRFAVRADSQLFQVRADERITGQWTHLVGMVTADKEMRLYVNGELAASRKNVKFVGSDPAQSLQIGGDDGSAVGEYRSPSAFKGTVDEVRVYHGVLSDAEIAERFQNLGRAPARTAKLVLSCTFDNGDAKDDSGNGNHGTISGGEVTKGRLGNAIQLDGGGQQGRSGGSNVKPHWTDDVPLLVRAMVLAGKTLFIAGPPDVMDEEKTFERVVARDEAVQQRLAEQDAILHGSRGGLLMTVSASDGKIRTRYELPALPVWDGMAAANGKLYIASTDGSVSCLAGR